MGGELPGDNNQFKNQNNNLLTTTTTNTVTTTCKCLNQLGTSKVGVGEGGGSGIKGRATTTTTNKNNNNKNKNQRGKCKGEVKGKGVKRQRGGGQGQARARGKGKWQGRGNQNVKLKAGHWAEQQTTNQQASKGKCKAQRGKGRESHGPRNNTTANHLHQTPVQEDSPNNNKGRRKVWGCWVQGKAGAAGQGQARALNNKGQAWQASGQVGCGGKAQNVIQYIMLLCVCVCRGWVCR